MTEDPDAQSGPAPDANDPGGLPWGRGILTERIARLRLVRTAGMVTAVVGVIFGILTLVSYLLVTSIPHSGDTAEILAFYANTDRRRVVLVGLYLMPFAGIAFLWFEVALRMWIAGTHFRANALLSNVQLVSGVVFIALFFAAAATSSATAAAVELTDAVANPSLARLLPVYGDTLMFVFAIRMAAMFVFTTTSIARSADVLPSWFAWLGYTLGAVLLLTPLFSTVLALSFPTWVLVLSALLFRHARRLPADLTLDARRATRLGPPGASAGGRRSGAG